MPAHSPDKAHIPFLDGLRGLMAFWVLAGHTAYAAGASNQLPIINNPTIAVDVFMFISGFLMAYYFRIREEKEPWHSTSTWRNFYIRRFFRIAPIYYLLLTTAFIFQSNFRDYITATSVFPQPWIDPISHKIWVDPISHKTWIDILMPKLSWINIGLHYTFLFGLIPKYAIGNVMPDWSIALEMQFYLVLPFIMLLNRRIGYFWATAILLFICLAGHKLFGVSLMGRPHIISNFPEPSFLPLKLNYFVVGILLAEAFHFRVQDFYKTALLCFMAIGLAGTYSSPYFLGPVLLSTFLLLYDPSQDRLHIKNVFNLASDALGSRIASFMADTSYGVYLLHNIILFPLSAYFITAQPWYVNLSPFERYGILLFIMICLTYPIAFLLHILVEKPGISLGKSIIRSLNNRKERAVSQVQQQAV